MPWLEKYDRFLFSLTSWRVTSQKNARAKLATYFFATYSRLLVFENFGSCENKLEKRHENLVSHSSADGKSNALCGIVSGRTSMQ